jgi:putative sterol carrier protein
VVKFLTQEWLDAQASEASAFPARPGASARLQYKVTGAPGGDVTFHTVIEDGRIVENALGDDASADFTRTVPYADYAAISKGELDGEAALMQGRVKVVGDMGKVMALIPLTQSPEYRAAVAQLDARTEY